MNKGGAPKGNRNAAKSRDWEAALRRALANYERGECKRSEALYRIAFRVIEHALESPFEEHGAMDAIKEIACRLDGKPTEFRETVTRRELSELSDAELEAIARGEGDPDAPASAPEPTDLH